MKWLWLIDIDGKGSRLLEGSPFIAGYVKGGTLGSRAQLQSLRSGQPDTTRPE